MPQSNAGQFEAADFVIENNILKGATKVVNAEHKLGRVILDALNESPNHVSQIDAESGEQTTCAEMKDRSIRCALWLKKQGIDPNDIVVVCTHNHLDSYVPVFATFFVDAIFNAWSHKITVHTARRYMKQFAPKVIFTCEEAAEALVQASALEKLDVKIVVFGEHSSLPTLKQIANSQTKVEVDNFTLVNIKSPRDLAIIMLSSGSTGFPKGVMLSSKSILTSILSQTRSSDDISRYMWYSTLDWISCIYFVVQSVVKKQTRIIPTHCEVDNLFQIIEKYMVNYVFFPPILTVYVVKSDLAQNYDLRSLKATLIGGCKHSKDVLEGLKQKFPNTDIIHGYGATEVGGVCYSTPATKHIDSTGFIVANCQAKFVDLNSGKSLGPNESGEVYVKSPGVMIGYYNNPEATKEAIDEEGWYHTGDIGYYDENGEVFIIDRIKEIMKYRNHQISPLEIEEILLSHPDIQEAVVVALPHKLDGDWPVAFCRKAPGSKVTENDLMKLTSVLEDYKKLRGGIHFIDHLLYTSSGKIARNDMKQFARNLLKIES